MSNRVTFELPEGVEPESAVCVVVGHNDSGRTLTNLTWGEPALWMQSAMFQAALDRTREKLRWEWTEKG